MNEEKEIHEETAPLLPGWNAWYVLVLGMLAVMILLFTWFTMIFS